MTGEAIQAGPAYGASLDEVSFSPKLILDETRAGGEPVIGIAPTGSIFVMAHPGWTHYHPSDDPTHVGAEILVPASGTSYLWKSIDGGAGWRHIGLPLLEQGPRSAGLGVSDPDLTVMADGTVCYTDLEGLAMSSVSCSTDDGETWLGNPVASGGPGDRPWVASHGDELYFVHRALTSSDDLLASKDRGLTWQRRGFVPTFPCDPVADPADGALVGVCGNTLAHSTDGGVTWEKKRGPDRLTSSMREPAIDAGQNVWVAWTESFGEKIMVGGTPDRGESWPWIYDVGPAFRALSASRGMGGGSGDALWFWVSAGSEGRVAVTWLGTYGGAADTQEWHVFTALLADAHTSSPAMRVYQVSDRPVHKGPICTGGTLCQVWSMQGVDSQDRRLGDFFETTIGLDGYLHVVVADTFEAPDDVISHVAYFRQLGGFPLVVEGDRPPTQG